jgi:hypothetical protein
MQQKQSLPGPPLHAPVFFTTCMYFKEPTHHFTPPTQTHNAGGSLSHCETPINPAKYPRFNENIPPKKLKLHMHPSLTAGRHRNPHLPCQPAKSSNSPQALKPTSAAGRLRGSGQTGLGEAWLKSKGVVGWPR